MSTDPNMSDQAKHSEASALRRRLLKASAAAPVVASLMPNSALAMASAHCAGGDVSNRKLTTNGNSINGDTAIRYAVDSWIKKPGMNPTGWANKLYLIDGEYYGQNGATYPASEPGLSDYYDHEIAYVLALFDISGESAEFVGLWPQVQIDDTYATPLTGSCWTSLGGDGGTFIFPT